MRRSHLITSIALLLAAAPESHAQPSADPAQSSVQQGRGRGGTARVQARPEVRILTQWVQAHPSNLPPGLAKRASLPPGLRKQVRRNGVLPPGLQKRATSLPIGLIEVMPALPRGRSYLVLGDQLLVVQQPGWVVIDVMLIR